MRIKFNTMQEKHFSYSRYKQAGKRMFFLNLFGLGIMITNF